MFPDSIIDPELIKEELFRLYFKTINRINILVEIYGDEKDNDNQVEINALLQLRSKLEKAVQEYQVHFLESLKDE